MIFQSVLRLFQERKKHSREEADRLEFLRDMRVELCGKIGYDEALFAEWRRKKYALCLVCGHAEREHLAKKRCVFFAGSRMVIVQCFCDKFVPHNPGCGCDLPAGGDERDGLWLSRGSTASSRGGRRRARPAGRNTPCARSTAAGTAR